MPLRASHRIQRDLDPFCFPLYAFDNHAAVLQSNGRLDCRRLTLLVTVRHTSHGEIEEVRVFWQVISSVTVGAAAIAIVAVMLLAITVRDIVSSIAGRD